MQDTTIIALAGIATSGLLGPAGAAWWSRLHQRRQFAHEHALKQREDLRALLDEAAQVLGAGATNLRTASEGREELTPALLHEWSLKVHLTRERLLLRLPPDHPVVTSYTTARAKLTELGTLLDGDPSEAQQERVENEYLATVDAFLVVAQDHLATQPPQLKAAGQRLGVGDARKELNP